MQILDDKIQELIALGASYAVKSEFLRFVNDLKIFHSSWNISL